MPTPNEVSIVVWTFTAMILWLILCHYKARESNTKKWYVRIIRTDMTEKNGFVEANNIVEASELAKEKFGKKDVCFTSIQEYRKGESR